MLMQIMRPDDLAKGSAAEDTTSTAERAWSVGHARAFVVGLVVTVLGFWMPAILGWYFWVSHA